MMNRRTVLLALVGIALGVVIAVLVVTGDKEPPGPPPDLIGEWSQTPNDDYYQIATVTADTIEIYWYRPKYGDKELYWSGSFIPPEDDREPYIWDSVNNLKNTPATRRQYRYARDEETKEFTYQDGKILYSVYYSRLLRMTAALEKVS